jgi:iron complex outermembrane receptor protein
MKLIIRLLAIAILAGGHAVDAGAQAVQPAADLGRVSIEDLMNIQVTSASRKEQRLGEVPAAVFVLTREDIRRSGSTTVPDVLRLVPGVQVAQMNANKWAVSVRGFNGVYSNKLLVLVDGRSVYNRVFSGVLWDAEDLVLDDIDRIEVTRGPGGALWGANAVNGVINIVTRSAADTSGALVRVGGGTSGSAQGLARYGGSFGRVAYRVYSQWTDLGDSLLAPGVSGNDNLRRTTAGFRSDWTAGAHTFMLQGRATRGSARELWLNFDPTPAANRPALVDDPTVMTGGMLLARWTHVQAGGASLQVQSTLDLDHRNEPPGDYHRQTGDVDVQYHTSIGARHDLVAGAGYRLNHEGFAGRHGFSLTPQASTGALFNAFAQDEIAMAGDRLHLSLGARVDRDGLAGWGVLPTAQVTWDVVPKRQHLWAKTARTLRTPALTDRGIRIDFAPIADPASPLPIRPSIFGNPDARTEEFADVETGYRVEIGSAATVSVTGFIGRYHHLQTSEPLAPAVLFGAAGPYLSVPVRFDNLGGADTKGLEIDAHWAPVKWWRLGAGYTAFKLVPHPYPSSHDAGFAVYDGAAPSQQWQAQSGLSLGRRLEIDAALFHVGALEGMLVPAYTRADARLESRLTGAWSAVVAGQNLLGRSHQEFTGVSINAATRVPRSVRLQLTWRFPGR